jgi:hypothetical protein
MARGTRYLAAVWQAAWDEGGGDQKIGEGPDITEKSLMDLYNDPKITPSLALNQYPDDMRTDWANVARPDSQSASNSTRRRSVPAASTARNARTAARARSVKKKIRPATRKKRKA